MVVIQLIGTVVVAVVIVISGVVHVVMYSIFLKKGESCWWGIV